MIERQNVQIIDHVPERQQWESIRRAFLAITAACRKITPDGIYTLEVRIIPRDIERQT